MEVRSVSVVDHSDAFEQSDMFPDLLPWQAVEFWKAVKAIHGTGWRKPITRDMIANRVGYQPNQIDRWHDKFPKLIPKPKEIKYGDQPPWVKKPELLDEYRDVVVDDVDTRDHRLSGEDTTGDLESYDIARYVDGHTEPLAVVVDENGVLRIARWGHGLVALAAALAFTIMLDGMDGRIDHVIRWCAIFGSHLRVVLGL